MLIDDNFIFTFSIFFHHPFFIQFYLTSRSFSKTISQAGSNNNHFQVTLEELMKSNDTHSMIKFISLCIDLLKKQRNWIVFVSLCKKTTNYYEVK